jgi:putative transposase
MANTYTSLQYHVVFSTKNRQPFLVEAIRERLFPYIGGIARENGMSALEIGGIADHVHLSKAVQLLKGGSSHWLKTAVVNMTDFGWQDGYAAFTVSQSQLDDVKAYIRSQRSITKQKRLLTSIECFLRGIVLSTMSVLSWVKRQPSLRDAVASR